MLPEAWCKTFLEVFNYGLQIASIPENKKAVPYDTAFIKS
jgi:hypothetical protein